MLPWQHFQTFYFRQQNFNGFKFESNPGVASPAVLNTE